MIIGQFSTKTEKGRMSETFSQNRWSKTDFSTRKFDSLLLIIESPTDS